jgi:DNA primase
VPTWIDLGEFRAKLRFEQVLRYYGIEINRKGDQHQSQCPLPEHGGRRDSPTFSANLERGIFHCFGCKAKGNVLEFAVLMEKVSLTDGRGLRDVAVKLRRELHMDSANAKPSAGKRAETRQSQNAKSPEVIVNQPLDFELKGLDGEHPYLKSKGLSRQTTDHFGLGFCSRGALKDRIAIPLCDAAGHLVGYAGEVIDESLVPDLIPRYSFPERRKRGEVVMEFRKSLFLYDGFQIRSPVDELIVVEDFASVWWLHEHGFRPAVALMEPECSQEQLKLIASAVTPFGRVWVMTSQAGERLAQTLLPEISARRFVRWVRLTGRTRPVDLSAEKLKACFSD